ncbi:hypothetical protein J2Y89_000298 [Curtobacterium herbarum]|nr:hypothetical protein [Curtobacterium herbarum]
MAAGVSSAASLEVSGVLASAIVVAALIGLFCTRGCRGFANAVARLDVVEERASDDTVRSVARRRAGWGMLRATMGRVGTRGTSVISVSRPAHASLRWMLSTVRSA